jgi:hypothetical protein
MEDSVILNLFRRAHGSQALSPTVVEQLEDRKLCFASIPAGDVALGTIQIRPAAGTYNTDLTLSANVSYFLRATGITRTATNAYHGDAAFRTGTTSETPTSPTETSTWGITANVHTTSTATSGWGAYQGDHIYGQTLTPTAAGALSFTFGNDALDKISTLAVTIYAPEPVIKVATIRTDVVTGSVTVASLPSNQVFLPLNNADWDHNGTADDKQTGAVQGDKFLLPITLPAVTGATGTSHIFIEAPKGLRVWLNPDRTGSTVGIGLRANSSRTVYVEATAEQAKGASVNLRVLLPIGGIQVEQDVPITVFSLGGPTTATGGSKQTFSSDATTGKWRTAVGGTLDTSNISLVHKVSFANVVWNDTSGIGFADFQADADYLWGWPVSVTA